MQPSAAAASMLACDDENQVTFCRGIVALCGTAIDRVAQASLGSVEPTWQQARQARDGQHFHLTFLSKPDLQRAAENIRESGDGEFATSLRAAGLPQPDPNDAADIARCAALLIAQSPGGLSSWIDIGEGSAKDGGNQAVFRVILWPAAAAVRRALGLARQDFHISLGFHKHDVHGKSKGIASLTTGAPSAESVTRLVRGAATLLESGAGSLIDAEGVQELAAAALLGATSNEDVVGEAEALRVLCTLHGRMSQPEKVLPCADRLLELDPSDEAGTRSRAFALVMLARFEEALPALALARVQLHKLDEGKQEVEEGRISRAEAMCQSKLNVTKHL